MSDLWARVDLKLMPTVSAAINSTPLNDMANVVETVSGQAYLLSLSATLVGATYGSSPGPAIVVSGGGATEIDSTAQQNGNIDTSVFHYPWRPIVAVTKISGTVDVSSLNDLPATYDQTGGTYGGFLNAVGGLFWLSSFDHNIHALATLKPDLFGGTSGIRVLFGLHAISDAQVVSSQVINREEKPCHV